MGHILEFPIEMAGHPYNRAGATTQPVMILFCRRLAIQVLAGLGLALT